MRKIYPPPFNKFAVFVLYGLLSIAAVTLAQTPKSLNSNCLPQPMGVNLQKKLMIGYIRLNPPPQPPTIEPGNIPWDSFDYINVIAYPKDGSPWNNIRRPQGDFGKQQIQDLVSKKGGSKTKILLSIRDYDPNLWPDDEATYGQIVTETVKTITEYGLNGVDIEYPGLRAILCHGDNDAPIWANNVDSRAKSFAKFIGKLKTNIGEGKTLMVTAGREAVNNLDGNIDYLNIETYHYSVYENLRINNNPPPNNNPGPPNNNPGPPNNNPGPPNNNPPSKVNSYPNSPNYEFDRARTEWVNAGISDKKIIMGLDFGNTFQVVNNAGITQSPEVSMDNPPNDDDLVIRGLKKINICPQSNPLDDKLHLYSIPWKELSKSILELNGTCNATKNNWKYGFDKSSQTPWLNRPILNNPNNYQFISYEDPFSLNQKLSYPIGGMSISDISYDDSDFSLLKYITGSTLNDPNGPLGPNGSKPGNSPTTNPTTASTNSAQKSETTGANNGGKIVGAVFGSLIGIAILGAICFIVYRYRRDRPKSLLPFLKSLPNRNGFSSSSHTNLRNTEMTTDTSHRYDPQTTVLPVASGYVTAIFDFTGKEENDLSFKKGDKIEVLERGDGPNDWWVGRVNGAVGEFPGNYVKET